MRDTVTYIAASLLVFAIMVLFAYAGHWLARRRGEDAELRESTGVVTGAVFALLGLLVAFTFSGAQSRLDDRRHLIVEEVNAMGTAYNRLDLLPQEAQPSIRELFGVYAHSRAELFGLLTDPPSAFQELDRNAQMQLDIWRLVVEASEGRDQESTRLLLLPALNQMFDLASTRTTAIQTHPPGLLYSFLTIIALMCAGLVGYNGGPSPRLNAVHTIGFSAVIALTYYVILDLDHPRMGLIRLEKVNEELVRLAESMD